MIGAGVLAAALVVAAGAWLPSRVHPGARIVPEAGPAAGGRLAPFAAVNRPAAIEWRSIDLPGFGSIAHVVAFRDRLVALGTGPGDRGTWVRSSPDGVNWTPFELPLPEGTAPAQLTAAGDTLLVLAGPPQGFDARDGTLLATRDGSAWVTVVGKPAAGDDPATRPVMVVPEGEGWLGVTEDDRLVGSQGGAWAPVPIGVVEGAARILASGPRGALASLTRAGPDDTFLGTTIVRARGARQLDSVRLEPGARVDALVPGPLRDVAAGTSPDTRPGPDPRVWPQEQDDEQALRMAIWWADGGPWRRATLPQSAPSPPTDLVVPVGTAFVAFSPGASVSGATWWSDDGSRWEDIRVQNGAEVWRAVALTTPRSAILAGWSGGEDVIWVADLR